MGRKLGEQMGGRKTAKDQVIVDWRGYFRDEFNRAWNLLDLRFQAAAEGVGWAGLPIYEAIDAANEEQRRLNRQAEEAATEPG